MSDSARVARAAYDEALAAYNKAVDDRNEAVAVCDKARDALDKARAAALAAHPMRLRRTRHRGSSSGTGLAGDDSVESEQWQEGTDGMSLPVEQVMDTRLDFPVAPVAPAVAEEERIEALAAYHMEEQDDE